MRGRSHRLQSADPHEDWVDGSWTVDCVCGVTFDDGEEMVNCDECGVWVHTRCSKYVKGEELFACDKCKSKSNRSGNGSHHNDSEETEVAQLLVELPTKTVRMEGSFNGQARRPVRLWTDTPMENRVHVQGIPGGDPELFSGLSSVFTPELWKCSGYVPKKLNFQYREFPCWDEKENGGRKQEGHENENENPDDKGAGMLFSLSKETVLATPVAAFVGMRGREEESGFERKVHSKEMKTWENEGVDFKRSQNGAKKERSLLRPVVVYSGKRKREDLGTSKDRNGKKKARSAEKEVDDRKRGLHASKTVFRPTSDAKPFQFYEDRGAKSSKTDMQSLKKKSLWEDVHQEPVSECHLAADNSVDKHSNILSANEQPPDASLSDISKHNFSNEAGLKEELSGHNLHAVMKSPPKTDNIVGSLLVHNDAKSITVNEEGDSVAIDKLDDSVDGSAKSDVKPLVQDMFSVAPEVVDKQVHTDFIGDVSQSSVMPNLEVKIEVDNGNSRGNLNFQSSSADAKVQPKCYGYIHEISKANDVAANSSQSSDHAVQDAAKASEAVGNCHTEKADEVTGESCQIKREVEGTASAVEVQKSYSESKHSPGFAEEQSKAEGASLNSPALPGQRKMIVCVGKSSSTSSNTVISKSSASDNFKSSDTQNSNLNIKQKVISDKNASVKKDHAQSDLVRDDERHDILKKTTKEHSRSSVNSVSKVSHSSRISQATVLKRTISDSKDSLPSSSSKPSSMQNVAVTSGSSESAGSLLSRCALPGQNKTSTSGLPVKGDKLNQSNFQSSPKVNHAPPMHPPAASNSPATLSDEELALLLHQELNSSPRVPRVPRMRHTGSLPQLASPTATSMLIKRTSSSGGKDLNLGSRRKNKDASKDRSRGSRDFDDEARRTDRVPFSPDRRRQDGGYTVDAHTKREDNGSPTAVYSVKKNMPSVSTTTANSGPSSSTEANDHVSSVRHSPRNISDDDTGSIRAPVHRTLPGLINEIMSKGKRMAYEELCNAVLPHWPHLRKHNGERYAYATHSQAVLDCLRNRHEWARLVDRGPKTNSSRKRRKLDADESEDNEYDDGRTVKGVDCKSLESQKEEFPKGKRKARKRRRLVLQGRGIKDVRKRRKADLLTDDDDPFSNSSDESMFSEDETHGGGAGPAASEASASSDEAGTT
ncbi:hypothetical protein Ddye_002982 [Dipteronia dyeriana]|uniref:Zinc finger PHD-type domain-containing protein n=1 Tax=Dipteronia dyeriana TaxID=168575 RepID=A0AAE0CVI3_9ROSI|nr:hypothetical protein Ddye_002982 [Dipteronia dyeriana]